MHEASVAGGILQVVEDAARREGFVRVTLGKELRIIDMLVEDAQATHSP